MQHAAQLLALPVSFGWHAAEHDLLSVVVAHLRQEYLERTQLVAAHRPHMSTVYRQRDRSRLSRWRRRLNRSRPFQSGSHAPGAAADRLTPPDVREGQEVPPTT